MEKLFVGDSIHHNKFGYGMIVGYLKDDDTVFEIFFDLYGKKYILVDYQGLTKASSKAVKQTTTEKPRTIVKKKELDSAIEIEKPKINITVENKIEIAPISVPSFESMITNDTKDILIDEEKE